MHYLKKKKILLYLAFITPYVNSHSQNHKQEYASFLNSAKQTYSSFRSECNHKYVEFLKTAWSWHEGNAPLPTPEDDEPIPPTPYIEDSNSPLTVNPVKISPIMAKPQPKPLEPIHETPSPAEDCFQFDFFGLNCKVRMPIASNLTLKDTSPNSIANGWEQLCNENLNNTIRDCLEARIRYNLCDWAYLLFLDKLANRYSDNKNAATLLMAFLYCQSGYQMRLAVDSDSLLMLFASHNLIYNKGYFELDNIKFYPYGETSDAITICNAAFEGESPLSLHINQEPLLGDAMTQTREIKSEQYNDICISSQVPENLLTFFDKYPTALLNENIMSRWAMYANCPLSNKTKEKIYPALKRSIENCSKPEAANRLLNWVQTGFVYEYDEKVWGQDRAFFAEETLYYPYCDCEDRSILFSRLVRDLLDLDVALIYYPGHLATAVCFNEDVYGDAMIIDDRKFIVCDPTYIGAPVGAQMSNLEYDKAQAIILDR